MKSPTTSTLKYLFAISGNICAFPECKNLLVESNNVVGEVCHIKGHKPDAARYDANQTEEQRHAFDNLILMCPNHHTIIDKDEKTYTVETLLDYKAKQSLQAKSPLSENDTTIIQFINNFSSEDNPSVINELEARIRERNEHLLQLQEKTFEPHAPSYLISWIDEVRRDIAHLKQRVNIIEPKRYKEDEISPPTNFHNVPQKAFFTGRVGYIDKVMSGLGAEERTWVVSMDGLGGIGKTSLATHCSYLCKEERLFEEIIWITAQQQQLNLTGIVDTTPSLVEFSDLLDEILTAFRYQTAREYPMEDRVGIVQSLLHKDIVY
ncbi:MAG: HNH endonuclease [Pyrinomonadaceae bacterium]